MTVGIFGPFDLTSRRGNSIRVLLQARGLYEAGFSDFHVFGYKVPASDSGIGFSEAGRNLWPKMLPIWQKIKKLPVDLVHVHHFYGAMVLRQRYILDMPSIISPQIEAMYKHGGPAWKKVILRKSLNPVFIRQKEIQCIKNAAAIIVASREIQENIEKYFGLKDIPCHLINNPVDLDIHKKAELNELVIGMSASDFRDSMDSLCLEVLYDLAAKLTHVTFRIAGKTGQQQVKKFKHFENVQFLGSLEHNEYIDYLSRISIFLMPYLGFYDYGGSKFKLLEAGASGLPVICSSFGAIGFDHKESLCIADSPDEIIEWIKTLEDRRIRKSYADRLNQVIKEQFDYKNEAQKLIKVYESFLN